MGAAATGRATRKIEIAGEVNAAGQGAVAQDAPRLPRLNPILACPNCTSVDIAMTDSGDALRCDQCATRFPVFRCGRVDIPWLFAEPVSARLEWKARYNGFLHANSVELDRLRQARGDNKNSKLARRRINRLLQAREQHRNQVRDILAPLQLEGINWPADATDLLCNKMPKNQGLSSYTSNIFRDWAWGNGENEALLDAIDRVLIADRRDGIGSTLTLGAGACRLPYDMQRRYGNELSVALDLNPLLLHIAAQVIQGDAVPMYEFPIAPLNEASFAILQECRAPGPPGSPGFHYVLADALNPPFAAKSFDTVVTPWLIDIIVHNLRSLIPRINQLLKHGGVWVNSGSLAFFHRDESWCFSEEEVLELVEENGFEILTAERRAVPYLQSPHSAHGRTEKIFSFSAVKTKDIDVPSSQSYLPRWVLDTTRSVPASTYSAVGSFNHLLTAKVLAAIDGKRTINQIGRQLAKQYGLGKAETIHAVRRILVDAWEESSLRQSVGDP